MPLPPFAEGRRWHKRMSKAYPSITHRVYHHLDDDYEYERDPTPEEGTWHRIDWRHRLYQEIDAVTGLPVAGGEGQWRRLR